MLGVVASFDGERGYGEVHSADAGELFFHCTAIADGTRTIAVGTVVSFTVIPGHLGRYEATGVTPVTGDSLPGR
jgi:cold shock CspA family protein